MDNIDGYHEKFSPSAFRAVKSSGAHVILCPTIHPCGGDDRISSAGVDFNCKAFNDHYAWLIESGGSCFKRDRGNPQYQHDADGVMMLIFHHSYPTDVENQDNCYLIKDADPDASYGNYENISAAWKAIAAGNYVKPDDAVPAVKHSIPAKARTAKSSHHLRAYNIFGRLLPSGNAAAHHQNAPAVIFRANADNKVVRELLFHN
jgi:hypothetical protein